MAIQKLHKLILGTGNITNTGVQSTFLADSNLPTPADGVNGDVWIYSAGLNSDILFKTNNQWVSLLGKELTLVLGVSQSGAVALSLPAASFRFIKIDYSLSRTGGDLEHGSLSMMTDTVDSNIVQGPVDTMGGENGVEFNAQVVGSNVQLTYNSDAGAANTFKYVLRGWN